MAGPPDLKMDSEKSESSNNIILRIAFVQNLPKKLKMKNLLEEKYKKSKTVISYISAYCASYGTICFGHFR